jgi:AraC-like DNA-binding protein
MRRIRRRTSKLASFMFTGRVNAQRVAPHTEKTKGQRYMSGSPLMEKKPSGATFSTMRQRSSYSAVRDPLPSHFARGAHDTVPSHSERKERAMIEELRIPLTVVVSLTPPSQDAGSTFKVERVSIAPSLPAYAPLLHHIALMLQATLESENVARQLSAQSLADALVSPFLRQYGMARHFSGEVACRLSPYKLRHTIAYIKDHLKEDLSLVTLAALGGTSPAHFARVFKHATGVAPHQYVLMCRIEYAKQLLAETEEALIDIGLHVGCADQSHFTALFHKHVGMTPKAYRDSITN